MSLDPTYLLLSLFVSSVGFVLYKFGRSRRRFPYVAVGATLMIYPYFVSDWRAMLGIAVALGAALWGAVRFMGM